MFITHPVLIVSSDKDHRGVLADAVARYGLHTNSCDTLSAAKGLLEREHFSAILCEDNSTNGSFSSLVRSARNRAEKVPVILVSPKDDWDSYLIAIRGGAFDRVSFPPSSDELERTLWMALTESQMPAAAFSKAA